MRIAEEHAARVAGAAWQAIASSGGPHATSLRHYPGALDRELVSLLPLPSRGDLPPGQPAALLDQESQPFERHQAGPAIAGAYARRPRTVVLEDIGHGDPEGWAAIACTHLTRLSGSALPVTCSVYESRHGDEGLGEHRDAWAGVVVQAGGLKEWRLGGAVLGLRAGDVLIVPKWMPHAVGTPADPGWSVHLAFAIGREVPP